MNGGEWIVKTDYKMAKIINEEEIQEGNVLQGENFEILKKFKK